jgi:hypothetical protein
VNAYTNFTEPNPVWSPSLACPGPDCGLEAQFTTALNGPGVYGIEYATLYTGIPDPAHPGVLDYHGTAVFHVTKSQCGVGTFTESITDGTADLRKTNPATLMFPDHNTWTIIPGSGTGQLAGITGTGTDDGSDASLTVAGNTGDPTANKGVHYGTLTCRLH